MYRTTAEGWQSVTNSVLILRLLDILPIRCRFDLFLPECHINCACLYAYAGCAEQADALTDDTSELLWRWDVRDAKVLGKGLRSAATDSRKRLVQVCARMETRSKLISQMACMSTHAAPALDQLQHLVCSDAGVFVRPAVI